MTPEPYADTIASLEGCVLDFRSFLLAASFEPAEDEDTADASGEPARVDDAQWVAWSDVDAEAAWAAAALAIDWGAAERMAAPAG